MPVSSAIGCLSWVIGSCDCDVSVGVALVSGAAGGDSSVGKSWGGSGSDESGASSDIVSDGEVPITGKHSMLWTPAGHGTGSPMCGEAPIACPSAIDWSDAEVLSG